MVNWKSRAANGIYSFSIHSIHVRRMKVTVVEKNPDKSHKLKGATRVSPCSSLFTVGSDTLTEEVAALAWEELYSRLLSPLSSSGQS